MASCPPILDFGMQFIQIISQAQQKNYKKGSHCSIDDFSSILQRPRSIHKKISAALCAEIATFLLFCKILAAFCAEIAAFSLFCKILAAFCAEIAAFLLFCKILVSFFAEIATFLLFCKILAALCAEIAAFLLHCKTGFSHQIWHTHSK